MCVIFLRRFAVICRTQQEKFILIVHNLAKRRAGEICNFLLVCHMGRKRKQTNQQQKEKFSSGGNFSTGHGRVKKEQKKCDLNIALIFKLCSEDVVASQELFFC